jgi:hypothetical protein
MTLGRSPYTLNVPVSISLPNPKRGMQQSFLPITISDWEAATVVLASTDP